MKEIIVSRSNLGLCSCTSGPQQQKHVRFHVKNTNTQLQPCDDDEGLHLYIYEHHDFYLETCT